MDINTLSLLFLFLIVPYVYYKLKYRFWSIQPVFHYHNFWYWLFPPGIIQHKLPIRNKFYNPEIQFDRFELLKTEKKALFTSMLKSHFMPKNSEKYSPSSKNIIDNFKNHNNPSFISLFLKQINQTKRILIGTMTTKPLQCIINKKKINIYYADNICVHPDYRKKGIAPQLIYSHYVNHRFKNKNAIFVFKREGNTTFIVPITMYKNYGFKIKYWQKDINYDQSNIEVSIINSGNFNKIINIIENMDKYFECIIKPNLNHLKYACEVKNLFISIVTINKTPVSIYFFKNPHVFYNDKKSIELIGSYNETTENIFVLGALISIDKIKKIVKNDILFIENISNNNIILKTLFSKYNAFAEANTSYYFYNFGYRPFESNKIFIID